MSKSEVEWCNKLEIWWLLRDIKEKNGYKNCVVSWGQNGSDGRVSVIVSVQDEEKYARFIYTQTNNSTGEKRDFDYKVPIIETACHYGGTRYWFKCSLYKNGQYCGRRVGVLYKDGDWFGCRHCYDLTYMSQNENRRHKFHPMFQILKLDDDIETLSIKMKRYTYKGKPTKKRRKLERLYAMANRYYKLFEAQEKEGWQPKKGRKN